MWERKEIYLLIYSFQLINLLPVLLERPEMGFECLCLRDLPLCGNRDPSVELIICFYLDVPKRAQTQERFLFCDGRVVHYLSVTLWDEFLSLLSQRLKERTFRLKNCILTAKKERVSFTNMWEDETNIIFILIIKTIQTLA